MYNAYDKKTAEISVIKKLISSAVIFAEEHTVHKKFNYFRYYAVNVKYDDEVFPIYLNVGRAKNTGLYHLYDITNKIRDTANRINGFEGLREFPSINDISTDSISDSPSKSQEKFSDRDISAMAETAKNHFGTTNDVRESGYITVNGKMLDFSGRHWGGVNRGSRQVDHEDIGEILPDDFDTFAITHKGDVNRNGMAKYEFEKYGSIRTQPETGSVELAMMPTDKQKSALIHFFKRMRALGEDTLRVDVNDLDKNGKLFPVTAFKYRALMKGANERGIRNYVCHPPNQNRTLLHR